MLCRSAFGRGEMHRAFVVCKRMVKNWAYSRTKASMRTHLQKAMQAAGADLVVYPGPL